MNIYGQDIELVDTEGEYVTDVIVLARSVRHDEHGKLQDAVLISTTDSTTGMIQRGIIHEALHAFVDTE